MKKSAPMNYPASGRTARVRVRGVKGLEGDRLYIHTSRILMDPIARSVRGMQPEVDA